MTFERLAEAAGAIPGVTAAAVTSQVPMGAGGNGNGLVPEGKTPDMKNLIPSRLRIVTPRYFETMGIPLIKGRGITSADRRGAMKVMVVSQSLADPARTNRVNRPPLFGQLDQLAQFTIAIQFDFNSARIRPDSFRAVGLMADALYHPYLQGKRFLIIGHTDGKGSREYNLKLSQQRADAIRAALIDPFGISSTRIEAVGLGEEQLLNRANPEAAENRRVQLINIGK